MMKVLLGVPLAKEKYCKDSFLAKRIKNQGFDASRDISLCYRTHMNRYGFEKTQDYKDMVPVMSSILDWFVSTEEVTGKLFLGTNHITIKLRFDITKLKES